MKRLLSIIVRIIRPGRTDPGRDAIYRRLRLLDARLQRAEIATQKAQRRADSAWTAVTRVQESVNTRLVGVPSAPSPQVPAGTKAGTSLKAALEDYNSKVTGG